METIYNGKTASECAHVDLLQNILINFDVEVNENTMKAVRAAYKEGHRSGERYGYRQAKADIYSYFNKGGSFDRLIDNLHSELEEQ